MSYGVAAQPTTTTARTWAQATDAETHRLYRAVMLAPTLPICEAPLRLERLPIGRLDPEWVRKLGVR